MKNKKRFRYGMEFLAIGLFEIIMMILRNDFDLKGIVVCCLAIPTGIYYLYDAKEPEPYDEAEDERDVFIKYKARSITCVAIDILMLLAVIILSILYTASNNAAYLPYIITLLGIYITQIIIYIIAYEMTKQKN